MAGVIQTSQSFANGDSVTSTKLNAIATGSSFTSGAVTGTGLTVTGSGTLSLGTVASSNMGTDSVLTASIANGAVAAEKLSQYAPKWSAGFTYLQSALELGPELLADSPSYIDFHSSFPSIDFDARIIRNSGVNGIMEIQQTGTGSLNFTSSSGGFKFGTAPMPTPSGTAPLYAARAAVDFNADAAVGGNCTIRKSFNVSSVKKTAVGKFEINLTTALPSADCVCVVNTGSDTGGSLGTVVKSGSTASIIKITTGDISNYVDYSNNNVIIFA